MASPKFVLLPTKTRGNDTCQDLLFYFVTKYFQSVHSSLVVFLRIAILSLPKEKASCAVKCAAPGLCWITRHPFEPSSGRPIGSTLVSNMTELGGLFRSATLFEYILKRLLFKLRWNTPLQTFRFRKSDRRLL